jgi:Flp pilus assembly protein TadG
MTLRQRHKDCRRAETGATLVEFALVAPVVFLLLFGLIGGAYLAYQNSALHDGATAGARTASIETSLVQSEGGNEYCESGTPTSIETSVAQAAPLLHVNMTPLCASTAGASVLTQGQPVPGDVNITVTCTGGCAAPTATSVTLSYTAQGLVAPFGLTYNMKATSQDPIPVFNPTGS